MNHVILTQGVDLATQMVYTDCIYEVLWTGSQWVG